MPMRCRDHAGMPAVFLTGGTGFLGSHLAAAFLSAGRKVVFLARSARDKTANDRVRNLLDWFGLEASARRSASVLEGNLLVPGLGIDPASLKDSKLRGSAFIHCGSNTSFSDKRRPEVEAVNLDGLAHVLDFAARVRAGSFHLVSTAYVAGRTKGLCLEQPSEGGSFNNVYEETKCRAEWMAREFCQRAGLGLVVYRPSVVYGDSRTGRSLSFKALYYPVRTLLFMKKIYERDILENQGERAGCLGIRSHGDGRLHFPLRIEVGGREGVNVVPVNYFVDAFQALMTQARDGDFFHIVSENPTPIARIISYIEGLFGLTGLRACRSQEFNDPPLNHLERLFAHCMEIYGPYMKDERVFTTERSRPLLERWGVCCPEFDEKVFGRCMNYALCVNWEAEPWSSLPPESSVGPSGIR